MKTDFRNKPHLALAWADELVRHPKVLDAVEDRAGTRVRHVITTRVGDLLPALLVAPLITQVVIAFR